jgi:hypothetical protein
VIEEAGGAGAVRAKYVAATANNLGIQGAPQQRHGGGTMKSKQAGITLIGFLIVLIVVAFFGYMVMKLFPSYTEYGGVVKAMEQEASSGADGKTLDDIRRDLIRKMDFQYVDDASVAPSDITIRQGTAGNELHVEYDKQVPFMYNISFLIHFEKSVPMQGNIAQ